VNLSDATICLVRPERTALLSRGGSAVEVEGEEAGERVFLGDVGGPAIGGGDHGVEVAMRVVEPGRAQGCQVR
jgi:hypothetical protein